jgi:NAD(P)H-dependent nitrite reductase small subunit
MAAPNGWHAVCDIAALAPDRGVAALVDGQQLALFRIGEDPDVFVLDNVDPFTGVGCLSRGIVGDVGGELMVASPLYKQRFSLRTGRCLDDPEVGVTAYEARIRAGVVEVQL